MNRERRTRLKALDFVGLRALIADVKARVEVMREEVEAIRDEEQEALDNMPESLQEGERGEAMNTAIEQLESLIDGLDESSDIDSMSDATETFENEFEW